MKNKENRLKFLLRTDKPLENHYYNATQVINILKNE